MKKIVWSILILLVAAGAGAYFYFYQPMAPEPQPETLLPRDTLAMLRINHIKDGLARLSDSRTGRAVAGIEWQAVRQAMAIDADRFDAVQKKARDIKAALDSPWFNLLFGQTITAAVLPVTPDVVDSNHPEQLLQPLVAIVRLRHPDEVVGAIGPMLADQADFASETHDGLNMTRVNLENGFQFYYAISDRQMVVATHPRTLSLCLQAPQDKNHTLMADPIFQDMQGRLVAAEQAAYNGFFRIEQTLAAIKAIVQQAGASAEELLEMDKAFGQADGFICAGLSADVQSPRLWHQKVLVRIDRNAMAPSMVKLIDLEPQFNPTLGMLPGEPLAYGWYNNYDLKAHWQRLMEAGMIPAETADKFRASIENAFDLPMEEVLDAVGAQFALLFNDVKSGGIFPLPELALMAQSSNSHVVDRLMTLLAARGHLELKNEIYKGCNLNYAVWPMGNDFSPAYACKDGFCTLATNRQLLKAILDAPKSGGGLAGSEAFQAVNQGLTDANNQVIYARLDRMLTKAQELLNWGIAVGTMADPEKAGRGKALADQVMLPLLEALKVFQSVGGRTRVNGDFIENDMYLSLNPAPTT